MGKRNDGCEDKRKGGVGMRSDDEYRAYLEREKIESFDRIVDTWQEKDLSWQKRASIMIDIVKEYLDTRGFWG